MLIFDFIRFSQGRDGTMDMHRGLPCRLYRYRLDTSIALCTTVCAQPGTGTDMERLQTLTGTLVPTGRPFALGRHLFFHATARFRERGEL